MFSEAIQELQRAIELSGPIPHFVAMIAHVKALGGDRAAPAQAVAELKALSEHKYVSPYDIALVYLSSGNREQALHFLERAYQQRDPWLSLIRAHPRFNTLSDDKRFQDLMRRIGLAES
jgi:predicted Zn-dependent protease